MGLKDVESARGPELVCKDPSKWGALDYLSFSWMNK